MLSQSKGHDKKFFACFARTGPHFPVLSLGIQRISAALVFYVEKSDDLVSILAKIGTVTAV